MKTQSITRTQIILISIGTIVFIVIIGIPGSKIMKAVSDYIDASMYKELSLLFVFSMAISPLIHRGYSNHQASKKYTKTKLDTHYYHKYHPVFRHYAISCGLIKI